MDFFKYNNTLKTYLITFDKNPVSQNDPDGKYFFIKKLP